MHIRQQTTSTGGPEKDLRQSEALRRLQGEAHDAIGDDARDGRRRGWGIDPWEQVAEGLQASGGSGGAKGGYVLSNVGVGWGESVGDGLEAEVWEAVEGGGAVGTEEAAVVVFGVDEGDEEAVVVEEFG